MELKNLASVAANFRTAGTRRLVIAGVLEEPDRRARYESAIGLPLTVCRLVVDVELIEARLRVRHAESPQALTWYPSRAGELPAILDKNRSEDFTVTVGHRGVAEVALEIVEQLDG